MSWPVHGGPDSFRFQKGCGRGTEPGGAPFGSWVFKRCGSFLDCSAPSIALTRNKPGSRYSKNRQRFYGLSAVPAREKQAL